MHQFHHPIFVIGSGAMAEAFVRGIVGQQAVIAHNVHVLNRNHPEKLQEMASVYGIHPASDMAGIAKSRIVVLATKPKDAENAIKSALPYLNGQLLVSLAAGVHIEFLQTVCEGRAKIVRTMPNIPVAVLEGVTAVSFADGIQESDKKDVLFLLQQIGDVVEIPEDMMDSVTAVSGSGPGFVSYFLEAMEDAAVKLGFQPALARRLVLQTVIGTAKTLSEWSLSPRQLRERVTSPGGTTEAGLVELKAGELAQCVMKAMEACSAKSAEMGRSFTVK